MEAQTERPDGGPISLVLAVIKTSDTPLLLLDGDLRVVALSISFCAAFGIDPASAPGKSVLEMGNGEWNVPQLRSLLSATASGAAEIHAYEFDLNRPDENVRHLVLNAHLLDYDDKSKVRLLLAVADVTDARASEKIKDDLIRDKAILLREVQHWIANSLQIIASVLLQSARRVQSEETRGHLKNAHSRVMSIASVQQQLAQSAEGDVALRSYISQLCTSLGASMIEDPERISIRAVVDDTVVGSDVSISLGLIVTELVSTPSSMRSRTTGAARSWWNTLRMGRIGRWASATMAWACRTMPLKPSPASEPASSKRWPTNWAPRSTWSTPPPERPSLSPTRESPRCPPKRRSSALSSACLARPSLRPDGDHLEGVHASVVFADRHVFARREHFVLEPEAVFVIGG